VSTGKAKREKILLIGCGVALLGLVVDRFVLGEPAPLNEDVRDLQDSFREARVESLVVGAHATAVHGVTRATGDLDLLVRPSEEDAERVVAGLAQFGAPLELHGGHHLLEFSGDGDTAADLLVVQVACKLLADGGGAPRITFEYAERHGRHRAEHVDAPVRVESVILRGPEGIDDVR